MPIPKDKAELQKAIVDNYQKLSAELADIPTKRLGTTNGLWVK